MFALILALAVADSASAEADIFSILEEDRDVIVTVASRAGSKLSEAPSSVWVIDRKTIEASAGMTVPDLLRRVPGLLVVELETGQIEVVVRGWGRELQSRILYMIDGRSVLGEYYGATDIFAVNLDLAEIERIEVVLGPASTLYGANAFSAVVNLISRKPEEAGWRVRGTGRGGISWAGPGDLSQRLDRGGPLAAGFAEYSQAFGPVGLRLSLSGDFISASAPPVGQAPSDQDPEPSRRILGNADVAWMARGWSFRTQLTGSAKASRVVISQAARFRTNDVAATVTIGKKALAFAGDAFELQLWAREIGQTYNLYVSTLPVISNNFVQWAGEISAQYASPRFYKNRLVAGMQARWIDVKGVTLKPEGRVQHFYGMYLEDELRPIEPVLLTLGVRLETREAKAFKPLSRFRASPRGAIVLLPAPGQSFRAEVSTAFRNPTPVEGFQDLRVFGGAVEILLANPSLAVEEHLMTAVGYQGTFGWLRPRLELFYGQKRRLISVVPVNPTASLPVTYANLNDQDYYGASAYLEATPVPALSLFAHYTFVETRERDRASGDLRVFDNSPKHLAGLGTRLELGRFTGTLDVYAQGTSRSGSPFVVGVFTVAAKVVLNARLAYAFDSRCRVSGFVAGTNLIDARFSGELKRDFANFDAERVGPRVWAGVALALGSKESCR